MDLQITRTQDGVIKYPLHRHKSYEIMLYLFGEGYMRADEKDIPFCPGTIIIVPPEIRHGSVSEKGFKNISVQGDFDRYFDFDYVISISDNEHSEGTALAELIYENRYGSTAYLEALCTSYIYFLTQRFKAESPILLAVNKISYEISENAFDSAISLSRILRKSGYSEDYIRAKFKRIIGKTPTEFLTEIRIKHALFLIDVYKNSLSLSEIAEKCGYLDYVYFSKKFKQVVGVSPQAYKNNAT